VAEKVLLSSVFLPIDSGWWPGGVGRRWGGRRLWGTRRWDGRWLGVPKKCCCPWPLMTHLIKHYQRVCNFKF